MTTRRHVDQLQAALADFESAARIAARWGRLLAMSLPAGARLLAAPSPLADRSDEVLPAPSQHPPTVQELHLVAVHLICPAFDEALMASADDTSIPVPRSRSGSHDRLGARAAARLRDPRTRRGPGGRAVLAMSRPEAGPTDGEPGAGDVLVLRASGLGDLLTAVPALRGIRGAFPGRRVTLATSPGLEPLARLTGAVDAVLTTRELRPLPIGPSPAVAVNLHGSGPRSHRVLLATRPTRLLAFRCPPVHHAGPPWHDDEHDARRWCRLIQEGTGVTCSPADLDLAPPPVDPPWRPDVVLHPGAAAADRRWPASRFARVAVALRAEGLRIAVTGTLSELPLVRSIAAAAGLPAKAVLAGRTDLLALAALVRSSDLVIAGDTGVAHLASAYRRPSVLLFGPMPHRWGPPRRAQHRVLWHPAPDRPWRSAPHGVAPSADPRLLAISVEEVLGAARDALAAAPGLV